MVTVTYDTAMAASRDAGNRAMRARLAQDPDAPHRWSVDDYNAAVREFNRLWPLPTSKEGTP